MRVVIVVMLLSQDALTDRARIPLKDPENARWVAQQKPLWSLTRFEVEKVLAEVHRRFREPEERFRAIHAMRLGNPYSIFSAGEEGGWDPDPVFRIDQTDCVLSVMTSLAMTLTPDLDRARALMGPLMYYRDPKNPNRYPFTFQNRMHDTYEWGSRSPFFRNIAALIAGDRALKLEGEIWVENVQKVRMTVETVPTAALAELLPKFPPIVVVGLCPTGRWASHVGVIFDGRVFVHATTRDVYKMIAEDALEVLAAKNADGSPKILSVMVFGINFREDVRVEDVPSPRRPNEDPAKLWELAEREKQAGRPWEEYVLLRRIADEHHRSAHAEKAVQRIHELERSCAEPLSEGRRRAHLEELKARAKACEESIDKGNPLGLAHARALYQEILWKYRDPETSEFARKRLEELRRREGR